GNAHHVGLLDGMVAGEHALDLERRDVDAARLDHLLEPAAEAHAPVVADEAAIAGDEVAVGVEGRARLLRVVVVAGRDVAAFAEPKDQKSGTASQSRSAAVRCWRSPM